MPDVPISIRNLSSDLEGLSVAWISDVHAGNLLGAEDLEDLFLRVAERRPDLVLLGGDLVNIHPKEIFCFEKALAHLSPPLGIHAIPGNHEYYSPEVFRSWRHFLEEHGVELLINKGVRLRHGNGTLWLGGIDDLTEGIPDLEWALRGRHPDETTVLMSHHPDLFIEAREHGVDLTLSGHTHGGQIKPFGVSPIRHSRFGFEAGLYASGEASLYVGRGVGVTAIPLRLGATPEVPFMRLTARGASQSSVVS